MRDAATRSPAPIVADLQARARAVRMATVRMAHDGKTPHVGSALSCADLLVGLYFHAMHIDPQAAPADNQDRFVMSKGHGCMSYYATLAERGYFPHALLATYAQNGGKLAEHPCPQGVPGIEIATGSLGHGLAVATGTALARQLDGRPGRVFVLLSDGECNEGSVWEAAMFATGRKLDNLIAIVDYNKLQAMGRSNEVTGLAPLADKWRAFGWSTREIDGHDMDAIVRVLDDVPLATGHPSAIVAHTVKGKGVSFMEDDLEWHYRPPNDDDLARALRELAG
jgi:transketolase